MRIYSSRCRTYQYTVTTARPCAIALDPAAIGKPHSFFDCLVVTVGVERGDLARGADATRVIRGAVADTAAAYIVIRGYGEPVARPERRRATARVDLLTRLADTLDVLSMLAERLEEHGERVHLMPFGWHYRIEAEPLGAAHQLHIRPDVAAWDAKHRPDHPRSPLSPDPVAGAFRHYRDPICRVRFRTG